jgi:hypothetical protein
MTKMSDPPAAFEAEMSRKLLNDQVSCRLARAVHGLYCLRLCIPLASASCIIPPALSVEVPDAGINSPPAIIGVRSDNEELPEPGPLVFARNTRSTLDLLLLDTDVDDVLSVSVFVDYTEAAPTAPRSLCSAPENKSAQRAATCALNALCLPADVGQTRLMRIVVFDRTVSEVGMPAFMSMPAGGRLTSRTYQLKCTS